MLVGLIPRWGKGIKDDCFYIWITQIYILIVVPFAQVGMTLCLANSTLHQVWHKKSTHHCMLFILTCSALNCLDSLPWISTHSVSSPRSCSLLRNRLSPLTTAYAIPSALEYSWRTCKNALCTSAWPPDTALSHAVLYVNPLFEKETEHNYSLNFCLHVCVYITTGQSTCSQFIHSKLIRNCSVN